MIMVVSMNNVLSQDIPERTSLHNAYTREETEHTHSLPDFRAAMMTSVGIPQWHERMNKTIERTCQRNIQSPQARGEAMVYVSSSACPL